jgi:hypothetical protein
MALHVHVIPLQAQPGGFQCCQASLHWTYLCPFQELQGEAGDKIQFSLRFPGSFHDLR